MDIHSEEVMRIATKLGLDLSVIKMPKTTDVEPEVPITEFRLVRAIGTCTLCKSTIVQYIKLGKKTSNLWITLDGDVGPEEVNEFEEIEEYYTKMRTCCFCRVTLLTWEKEDLVKYILDMLGPEISKKEVIKRMLRARKENDYKTYESSY